MDRMRQGRFGSLLTVVSSGLFARQCVAAPSFGISASSNRMLPVAFGSIKAMRQLPWPGTGVSFSSGVPFAFNSASAASMSSTSKQM